jgi:hypothetical protein
VTGGQCITLHYVIDCIAVHSAHVVCARNRGLSWYKSCLHHRGQSFAQALLTLLSAVVLSTLGGLNHDGWSSIDKTSSFNASQGRYAKKLDWPMSQKVEFCYRSIYSLATRPSYLHFSSSLLPFDSPPRSLPLPAFTRPQYANI